MKPWFKLAIFSALSGATLAIFWGDIPIQDQMKIVDALRNVASIVFGVAGAWIALVFPEMLKTVTAGSKLGSAQGERVFQNLLLCMLISTFIVAGSLLFQIIEPVAKQWSWLLSYRKIGRSLSFFFVTTAAQMEIFSLLAMLVPKDFSLWQLDEAKKTGMKNRMTSLRHRNGDSSE